MSNLKVVIGIDPSKRTGIAIYKEGDLTEVYTGDFWEAIRRVEEFNSDGLIVIIELPGTKTVWHKQASNRGAIERTAVNVGSVIREAELIIEYLDRNKIQTIIQRLVGKVSADTFKRITKWDGRTSQHSRDAAMLCYKYA